MEKSKDQDNEDVCAKGLNTCGRCGESLSTIAKLIRHQQKHRIEDRKSGKGQIDVKSHALVIICSFSKSETKKSLQNSPFKKRQFMILKFSAIGWNLT